MKFPRLEYSDYIAIRDLMEDVEDLTQQEQATLRQLKRVIAAIERVRKSKGMGKSHVGSVEIRNQVLKYFSGDHGPVRMSDMAWELRELSEYLKGVRDADFRTVVQAMIAAGKLRYAPGLKIKSGRAYPYGVVDQLAVSHVDVQGLA